MSPALNTAKKIDLCVPRNETARRVHVSVSNLHVYNPGIGPPILLAADQS
jgi:hypothetical protein